MNGSMFSSSSKLSMVINHCSNVAMKLTRVVQMSKFLSPDAVLSSRLTRESSAVCIPNREEIVARTDCERSLVSKRWGDARSVGSKLKWGLLRMLLRRLKSVGSNLKWGLSRTLSKRLHSVTLCP
jgi:hypothetical protein